MVGAQVVALRKPNVEELDKFSLQRPELLAASSAQTDDRGQYRIFGLKPGAYYLRATDSGEPPSHRFTVGSGYWFREWLGAQYPPVPHPGRIATRPGTDSLATCRRRDASRLFDAADQGRRSFGPCHRGWKGGPRRKHT